MSESDEVLNIVQEVLRGLMCALITGAGADPEKVATGIQAFAANPDLDQTSRLMLQDLASGADMLALAKHRAAGKSSS
jgi:hypothetical protein